MTPAQALLAHEAQTPIEVYATKNPLIEEEGWYEAFIVHARIDPLDFYVEARVRGSIHFSYSQEQHLAQYTRLPQQKKDDSEGQG